ncbi:uncharacterized protein LOC34624078 [Cyclospora cayetanensis]|uniref:Uncharacterized protein LOC34624078 n=1 Tax=Cyclospora cayetanensis TaxID=88456 RepID=A0A6P6S0Z2_9EIME|nr:uncharacterized protein LOC34624078 [Cyclospora cayetanensis]
MPPPLRSGARKVAAPLPAADAADLEFLGLCICSEPVAPRRPRRLSGFQAVKQHVLASSEPTEGAPRGPLRGGALDLTEQLSNLDVSEDPKSARRAFGRVPEACFPFSGKPAQLPARRGRGAVLGGFLGAPANRLPSPCSAACSREPSEAPRAPSVSGISLAASQPHDGGPMTPDCIHDPSPRRADQQRLFESSRGNEGEGEISTAATLPAEASQQQLRQQRLQNPTAVQGANLHLPPSKLAPGDLVFAGGEKHGVSSSFSARIGRCLDTLSSVCRFSLSVSLVVVASGSACLLFYSLLTDIMLQEQQRQAEAAAAAAACRQRHRDNGCETLDPIPPYLKGPCEEWRACLLAVPENHGETTKVAAQVVAQVLNAFFHSLHWRTIVAVTAFLWLLIYAYKTLHYSLFVSSARERTGCTACISRGAPIPPQLGPSLQQQYAVALQQEMQPYQRHMVLQQMEYEREVMRQQILRGSAPQLLLQSLGRQDAMQRELAYILSAEKHQPQPLHCSHSNSGISTGEGRPGFFRTLLGSCLFKFLVVLWVAYACVVGSMYAIKQRLI